MASNAPNSSLRSAAKRWKQHLGAIDQLSPATVIGVASTHTAEPIEVPLGVKLLEFQTPAPQVIFADFGQVHNACLDPAAVFGDEIHHLVLIIRIEDLHPASTRAVARGETSAATEIIDGFATLGQLVAGLVDRTQIEVTVALPPFPAPPGVDDLDPSASLQLADLMQSCVQQLRKAIDKIPSIRCVDTNAIVGLLGRSTALDHTKWAMYRQPYSRAMWNQLGTSCALAIARRVTPAPKCIVIDCDNTLWGGIIGEDGVGGIALGEDFPGRCFTEFQQSLLDIRQRGVLLAICSKNEEVDVLDVFKKHDAMQLKSSDISSWRVNWQPKSDNIAEIAAELNIGLDSVVFIDDSDFEISEVSTALPDVTCLQVPADTAFLPSLISDSQLFRMVETTSEDLQRTEMIVAEGARRSARKAMDRDEFLASLGLSITLGPALPEQISRITQLINKTNQFNLTTVRRSEAEVASLAQDENWLIWAMNVKDKFGDSGLVGVAIVDNRTNIAIIDTLLMSCRVLGRGVETALIESITRTALDAGACSIAGTYRATQKNTQVADLYTRHGFIEDDGLFVRHNMSNLQVPAHLDVTVR